MPAIIISLLVAVDLRLPESGMIAPNYDDATHAAAMPLAESVVHALADDLRNNKTWHECLSSADGHGLAAPGFLSWDTLGASLIQDVNAKKDPFAL